MIRQPLQDRGRFVGGDIVKNNMDIDIGVEVFGHMVEESDEVLGAVAFGHPADHATGRHIQGGEPTCGAMTDIVMGKGFWVRPKAGI